VINVIQEKGIRLTILIMGNWKQLVGIIAWGVTKQDEEQRLFMINAIHVIKISINAPMQKKIK